ncbi:hypothetical protein C4K04_2678 [Pseudomonas chlororaphis]|uniref:Lipoprotein n=1 Tax=Pseudomonas chlororaphis TaxID=587753 RepID=A0A3G7TMT8_9PSED|nr:hypothetical protein [Pseudomonas chlororaphis]AZE48350.1 hypothetical protein C4K04_2678 [Pseudomonas chlororaphis]
MTPRNFSVKLARLGLFLLLISVLGGCTVKLVADYDAITFEEILEVAKKIDKFYGDLLETRSNERIYQKYSSQYVDIETDIRSLVMRNQARALNDEAVQISEIILKLWLTYKKDHAVKDSYSDGNAKLDRGRFGRLFAAAASVERIKNLDVDDKDLTQDRK